MHARPGVIDLLQTYADHLTHATVEATFDYHFRPGDVITPVYAGLVPIDIRLLSKIRTTDLWVYFQSFTSILLGHPRYAVPFPMDQCRAPCTSVLLPGGLEMVRQVSPHLNLTVFHGGIFDNTEAIRVEGSRGLALAYDTLDPGFEFDWDRECIYAGQQMEIPDGVQLCVKQVDRSVVAGKFASVSRLLRCLSLILSSNTLKAGPPARKRSTTARATVAPATSPGPDSPWNGPSNSRPITNPRP